MSKEKMNDLSDLVHELAGLMVTWLVNYLVSS